MKKIEIYFIPLKSFWEDGRNEVCDGYVRWKNRKVKGGMYQ
jgi:hypothetical protein